jgi:NAD(P)-dependent dehydrogenase (short-subunit alcohol dehydrogenase family)
MSSVRDLFDLSGKTAIVTGGGSGLGLQMAEALAELGARMVLCARRPERCEQAAAALRAAYGVEAIGLRCDVRDRASIDAVVETAVGRFGTIDVLVNNSGTTWGAPAVDYPLEGWQKVVDVNLTGVFSFSQAVGRVMIEQRSGSIVNNASVTAFQGVRAEAMDAVAYNATKGAVVALTKDLAVKWAPFGVRVNALAPGWFPSEMSEHSLTHSGALLLERIPLGRFGEPAEIKGAVAFLSSPASSFVTGAILAVDGGQSAG